MDQQLFSTTDCVPDDFWDVPHVEVPAPPPPSLFPDPSDYFTCFPVSLYEPVSFWTAQTAPPSTSTIYPDSATRTSTTMAESDASSASPPRPLTWHTVNPRRKKPENAIHCPVGGCPHAYMRAPDLKLHLRLYHGAVRAVLDAVARPRSTKQGKKYCCPLDTCPSGYARKSDLTRHMQQKHDM